MLKDQFQQFLEAPFVQDKLPIHANFWKVTSLRPGIKVKSTVHTTHHYPISTFYKPISQCINLATTPPKNKQ